VDQCCSLGRLTLNTYVSQLNDVLTRLLDKVSPARTRRRRPQKPISKWLSAEAIAAKRARRRLERRWRAPRVRRQIVSTTVRLMMSANGLGSNESRESHYRQRIHEAGSDHRQRWKVVNELLHSKDTDKTRTANRTTTNRRKPQPLLYICALLC